MKYQSHGQNLSWCRNQPRLCSLTLSLKCLCRHSLRESNLPSVILTFSPQLEEDSVFDESDIHDTPTGPCNKESQTFFARLKRIGGSKTVKYQPVEMNVQRSMNFFLLVILCRNVVLYRLFGVKSWFYYVTTHFNTVDFIYMYAQTVYIYPHLYIYVTWQIHH